MTFRHRLMGHFDVIHFQDGCHGTMVVMAGSRKKTNRAVRKENNVVFFPDFEVNI